MYLNVKLSIYWHCHLSSFILLKYAAARINNGNLIVITVSTHSHPKMAARKKPSRFRAFFVSTHSRAKAAAIYLHPGLYQFDCFNTQPREGGCLYPSSPPLACWGFNTQPREGGCIHLFVGGYKIRWFQHTAARRRLLFLFLLINSIITGFNTQPREGGCLMPLPWAEERHSFNTQPREGGCELPSLNNVPKILVSTHSRAKAAAPYLKKQEKSAY